MRAQWEQLFECCQVTVHRHIVYIAPNIANWCSAMATMCIGALKMYLTWYPALKFKDVFIWFLGSHDVHIRLRENHDWRRSELDCFLIGDQQKWLLINDFWWSRTGQVSLTVPQVNHWRGRTMLAVMLQIWMCEDYAVFWNIAFLRFVKCSESKCTQGNNQSQSSDAVIFLVVTLRQMLKPTCARGKEWTHLSNSNNQFFIHCTVCNC